jgi:hypothetical protein
MGSRCRKQKLEEADPICILDDLTFYIGTMQYTSPFPNTVQLRSTAQSDSCVISPRPDPILHLYASSISIHTKVKAVLLCLPKSVRVQRSMLVLRFQLAWCEERSMRRGGSLRLLASVRMLCQIPVSRKPDISFSAYGGREGPTRTPLARIGQPAKRMTESKTKENT